MLDVYPYKSIKISQVRDSSKIFKFPILKNSVNELEKLFFNGNIIIFKLSEKNFQIVIF